MERVLVIAGPSAVGKTTLAHALLEHGFELVRSVTSRPPRGDGYDGEYIYTDREGFERLIREGGVLEYTEYAGALYGTPRSEINRISAEGRVPLLVLDLIGVRSLFTADGISSCAVYVYDDIEVMYERLFRRFIGDTPTPEGEARLASRLAQNKADYLAIADSVQFLYAFVKNEGKVEETAEKILTSFRAFSHGAPKSTKDNERIAALLSASVK